MLFDQRGNRKYLTQEERKRFLAAAANSAPEVETFCLTLAFTGARVSEALALTPARIDRSARAIIFECLKRRQRGLFRAVPIPERLLEHLEGVHDISRRCSDAATRGLRLWPW